MVRNRKKLKTMDSVIVKYPIDCPGFECIRDIDIQEDPFFLNQYGIPVPPQSVNFALPDGFEDRQQLVIYIVAKYTEALLGVIDDAKDEKFDKRRLMIIKLVNAMHLKLTSAYKWKAFDRKLTAIESLQTMHNAYNQTRLYIQIYRLLWIDHCASMREMLYNWNEAKTIIDEFDLDNADLSYEITDVLDKLNDMIDRCQLKRSKCTRKKYPLEKLIKNVPTDSNFNRRLQQQKLKFQRDTANQTNQLQIRVNMTIKHYESILEMLSLYTDKIINLAMVIAQYKFKRVSVNDYIKLIQIVKQYPILKDTIDVIFPKKAPIYLAKCQEHLSLILAGGEILFFQQRDGPWIPSLRLLHKYPSMLPKMQVDSGAIKFILRGSNIMCPGLTSEGGKMDEVDVNCVVQVTADGRYSACAIGITTMSTQEIREKNRDICIETMHYLNDGIWQYDADKCA